MTDHSRPAADEPSILSQLGFTQPTPPAPSGPAPISSSLPPHARPQLEASAAPIASSRRDARALERQATPVKRGKAPKQPKRSRSAERRIREVQKTYARPPKSARPARSTSSVARTIGSRILSVAAMVFAGALAVGMSVPANAFGTAPVLLESGATTTGATSSVTAAKEDQQSLDVASSVTTSSSAREGYTVTSWADMLRLQYGTRDYNYTMGDPNGPIRWPFPYEVPISSGFGGRAAPCNGCSSMHMGLDFTPGEGAPIYAIADGTVKIHDDDSGGYGNHVYIDHGNLLGDGSNITSLYAHMQAGSSALKVGDTIEVGDFIGTVGRTGTATGNHLHFEILVNDVQVDPFAWLKAHT